MFKPTSKRVRRVEPPPPMNPISQRPYDTPPDDAHVDADLLAAGQLALANRVEPTIRPGGFTPQRSAWKGTRP